MPLLKDAEIGSYVLLYYDEQMYSAFNDFCRSIAVKKTPYVSSIHARVLADAMYSSTAVGWISDPGGANEFRSAEFPEYEYAWLLDPETEVASIEKSLLPAPVEDLQTEHPCHQCGKKNYISDKTCWWCQVGDPTGRR